ncbi:DoxX family membrane protein [Flavobacterium sp. F52]|uniref:DoxX family membrane protein n=1 Tax=Flavobacterium sp. F52 TaxID=1202532 RepID=UPI000272DBEA|nr:DoxX family membrane protein [Flavobacterium sp. F52]EJG03196.1 hypothetical protein FF52_03350 [Flavobacterium sp. F52]
MQICLRLNNTDIIMQLLKDLIDTQYNYSVFLIRITAGIIIFPYGMQKLLGWFPDFGGGVGIWASLASFKKKGIPAAAAWMVILGQSLGSIALLAGFAGRAAAFFNFVIFTGAMCMHASEGWTMNWAGSKKGEGIEYFIMLLVLLFLVVVNGSGALSLDYWLSVA